MNDITVAMDPATLREVSRQLGLAAGGAPIPASGNACSVSEAGGDAAYQDFQAHWHGQLRELSRAIERTGRRASLTALAFQLLDGA
jgi:hypothetical protein